MKAAKQLGFSDYELTTAMKLARRETILVEMDGGMFVMVQIAFMANLVLYSGL